MTISGAKNLPDTKPKPMIEVEKKFVLNNEIIERLTKDAELISEKSFTDSYYDTNDFRLTTRDTWLRIRDDVFQLKVPLNLNGQGRQRVVDQYHELDTEEKIREALEIATHQTLKEDLEARGFLVVATFRTSRKKYRKQGFIIDLDQADFDYTIGEIELLAENQGAVDEAINKILAFAKTHELVIQPVRGKLIEYLKRFSPVHYHRLVEAGVVWDQT